MKSLRGYRAWVVALVILALMTACIPTPRRVVTRTIDTVTHRVAEQVADMLVERIMSRLLESAMRRIFGDIGITFTDDFVLDQTGGSFEVTLSGTSPTVGTFRADPLDPRLTEAEVESANVAIGIRSLDEEGAQTLMIAFYRPEPEAGRFHLVLVDAEPSSVDEDAQTAHLSFGDDDDDPYVGTLRMTSMIDTATRVAGRFEATGLMTASGAGPIDVVGTFNVQTNRPGTLTIERR